MNTENRVALGEAIAVLRSRMETCSIQNSEFKIQKDGEGEVAPIPLPPTLEYLADRFGLTDLEAEILLLCAAQELDDGIPKQCDRLRGSHNCPYPTFSLAFDVLGESDWEAVSSEGPLRHWRLLEVLERDFLPAKDCPLKIDDRVLNFLVGSLRLDRRLATLVFPLDETEGEVLPLLAPSQEAVVEEIVRAIAPGKGSLPIVQLLGGHGTCKQQIAGAVAARFGLSLFGILGQLIPTASGDYEEFVRLWEREARMLDLALYIDMQEVRSGETVQRFASQSRGLLFLDGRETRIPDHRRSIAISAEMPTPAEQRSAWSAVLGEEAGETPSVLAGQFRLSFGEIDRLAGETRDRLPREGALWNACLQRGTPGLEGLSQRLQVKAGWDNLVLPEEQLGQLWQIVHQVRLRSRVYDEWGFRARLNRGLGTAALFAGESGTGKTMAAEVIAKELNLHLYRIDLSAVVSKYIGETEKNLSRLFAAAEEGGAILFFDEADALFGKRSEVSDAKDRYANIEIDYLLQRIESYGGLAIMATNMKSALDKAFLRRLRFIVDFPFPSGEYRRAMWEKVFPPEVPRGALDYQSLARLELAGGAIYNIAINAAFLAAQGGEALAMEHVEVAARSSWQKLGRPFIGDEQFKIQNSKFKRSEESVTDFSRLH
ncbi:MAG: ATP-binding protein [Cyanobacteria bacterium SBLK]|nr:ATP-binding protein [Cyanobacteria bacterium SBLK]